MRQRPTGGAKPTSLTGEGHQLLTRALRTTQAQKAVGEDAALEKGIKLVFDEVREARPRLGAERGIPHQRIGKIVVATEESEVAAVKSYVAKAEANGVTDLQECRWHS